MCVHFRAPHALYTHFCALLGEKKDEKNEKKDQEGPKKTPDAAANAKIDANVLIRSSGRSRKKVDRSAPSTTPPPPPTRPTPPNPRQLWPLG